jgi:hypothetical protein
VIWWLLFGGIALLGVIFHGILGVRTWNRYKALRRDIDQATRKIDAALPASGEHAATPEERRPTHDR